MGAVITAVQSPAALRRQGWTLIVSTLCVTSAAQLYYLQSLRNSPIPSALGVPPASDLGMIGNMLLFAALVAAIAGLAYGYSGFRTYLVQREGLTDGAWVLSTLKWLLLALFAIAVIFLIWSAAINWQIASLKAELAKIQAEVGTAEANRAPEPAKASEPAPAEPTNAVLVVAGGVVWSVMLIVLALNVHKLRSTLFGLKQSYLWTLGLQVVAMVLLLSHTPIGALLMFANQVIMGTILLRAADAEDGLFGAAPQHDKYE